MQFAVGNAKLTAVAFEEMTKLLLANAQLSASIGRLVMTFWLYHMFVRLLRVGASACTPPGVRLRRTLLYHALWYASCMYVALKLGCSFEKRFRFMSLLPE